jgi:small subunit ribosomal protein S8
MNNNIIKFLIQLKNASLYNLEVTSIEHSFLREDILRMLYDEGFIQSFKIKKSLLGEQKLFLVTLRYFFNKPILRNLQIFSKPSHIKYMKFLDIANIPDRKFVVFFSTNKGLLTNLECKKNRIGGKLLFVC